MDKTCKQNGVKQDELSAKNLASLLLYFLTVWMSQHTVSAVSRVAAVCGFYALSIIKLGNDLKGFLPKES